MFTVRSVSQAGAFRDEDVDEMASLLELGLRAGVDWLDVETETLSDLRVLRCWGAFTSLMCVVSFREDDGWSLFRF